MPKLYYKTFQILCTVCCLVPKAGILYYYDHDTSNFHHISKYMHVHAAVYISERIELYCYCLILDIVVFYM